MAIKEVVPKRKAEQFDAFKKLAELRDAAEVVVALPDAADDGKKYIRKSEDWEELSVSDADIAADADIKTSKLEDGADIAALIDAKADVEALAAARGTPAAYSVDPENIAAVLVALGVMEADEE